MQLYQTAIVGTEAQDLIAETAAVMELLALTLAIIAQPGTPAILSKVLATVGQHTAMAWAEMLAAELCVVEGGAQ